MTTPTLRITVEWLDRRWHGREWPPAPHRLFQAMRASCARTARGCRSEREAALRHLETLPPPDVTAPAAGAVTATTAAVPGNDADLALALYARGAPAKARARTAASLTLRSRRARDVAGAVVYDWRATPETARHREALACLVRSITTLGLGIDLVSARATMHAASPPPVPGVRYTPATAARRRLRVPWPGAFDALDAAYRGNRTRIGAGVVAGLAEAPVRTVGYACELDAPPVRCAAFALRTPADRALALEGTRAVEVAAQARHAVGGAARTAGLDPDVVAALMGHRGEDRIRIAPLPSVGHRHADGRVRRVLLTAPLGVDAAVWSEVLARLAGAELIAERTRTVTGVLAPLRANDPVVRIFRAEAVRWTSATPVVLPGHDHRRGRPRPHRALERMLRHAGLSPALLASATLEPAPRLAGSAPAHRYRRPRHLARFPATHLTVTWRNAVAGPLALGAGSGYGLGLLVPLPQ